MVRTAWFVVPLALLLGACGSGTWAETEADRAPPPSESTAQAYTTYPNWGYLDQYNIAVPIKGTYFFPGEACVQGGPCPQVNFTSTPTQSQDLHWDSGGACVREHVVQQMASVGVNVVTMSYWGEAEAGSAPMAFSLAACDGLFTAAVDADRFDHLPCDRFAFGPQPSATVSIVPSIEFAEGIAPVFGVGTAIEDKIVEVVTRYLTRPSNPDWSRKWAKVYDQSGYPRYAVQLVGVGANRQLDDAGFVQQLDVIAANVQSRTQLNGQIGFMFDPGPGSGYRPEPGKTPFKCSVDDPNAPCAHSLLAISGFATEIWNPSFAPGSAYPYCDNNGLSPQIPCNPAYGDEIARLKRERSCAWAADGLPVVMDVNTGYDGHIVWGGPQGDRFGNLYSCASCPGGTTCDPRDNRCHGNSAIWGDNANYYDDYYRNYQSEMKGACHNVGITFNSWNGYTEGMVAVPSLRTPVSGQPVSDGPIWDNVKLNWLKDLYAPDPRFCSHVHYRDGGAEKLWVFGGICEEWNRASHAIRPNSPPSLVFGEPTTSEGDTPNHLNTRGRMNYFSHYGERSGIYWDPNTGAHALYGLIFQKYVDLKEDLSFLRLPVTTELDSGAWCEGGRYVGFQGGWIDYCPGVGAWAHSDPKQYYPGR